MSSTYSHDEQKEQEQEKDASAFADVSLDAEARSYDRPCGGVYHSLRECIQCILSFFEKNCKKYRTWCRTNWRIQHWRCRWVFVGQPTENELDF
jgi:hypothetical protein